MAGHEQRIVVGVDGSDRSKAALRWAVRQAELTGSSVDAVIAWQYPSTFGWAAAGSGFDFEGDARKILARALSDVCGDHHQAKIHMRVLEGPAAEALLDTATGADLLVVGSRGHGGFASAVLGSVSLHCVLHARCPVLVLRDGHEAGAALAA